MLGRFEAAAVICEGVDAATDVSGLAVASNFTRVRPWEEAAAMEGDPSSSRAFIRIYGALVPCRHRSAVVGCPSRVVLVSMLLL